MHQSCRVDHLLYYVAYEYALHSLPFLEIVYSSLAVVYCVVNMLM